MTYKNIKKLLKIASLFMLVLTVFLGSFFTWVITGPRSLSFISDYIETELNSLHPDYSVEVDTSNILWDKEQLAFSIDLTNVHLKEESKSIAEFPRVSFKFSIFRLLIGKLLSTDITIHQPHFSIDLQRLLAVKEGPPIDSQAPFTFKQHVQPLLYEGYKHVTEQLFHFTLKNIRVVNASFYIKTPKAESVLAIERGHMQFVHNTLITELNVKFGAETSQLSFQLTETPDELVKTNISFKNLPSYVFSDFFPDSTFSDKISIISSGSLHTTIDKQGEFSDINFDITDLKGEFKLYEHFQSPITITNLTSSGSINRKQSLLELQDIAIDFNGPVFTGRGDLAFSRTDNEELQLEQINLESKLTRLNVLSLSKFWPTHLQPKVRGWVVKHFLEGFIPEVTSQIHISKEDMQKIRAYKKLSSAKRNKTPPPISKDAVNATINLENSVLKISGHIPKIHDLSATINFDSHSMNAKIHKGMSLDSTIKSGNVRIAGLWKKPASIVIEGKAKGKNVSLIKFLKRPKNVYKSHRTFWKNIYNIDGTSEGSFSLNFPIKRRLSYPDLNLHVNAKLDNTNVEFITDNYSLSEGKLNLDLSPKKVSLDGKVNVNEVPLSTINFDYYFTHDKGLVTRSNLSGKFNTKEMQRLGLPDIGDYVQSDIDATLTAREFTDKKTLQIKADLKDAFITIPQISFAKAKGKKATFNSDIILKDSAFIEKFSLKGKQFHIAGNALTSEDKRKLIKITLDKARFDRNDYTATYEETDNEYYLNVKGNSVDLSMQNLQKKSSESAPQSKNISLDIKKVTLKNDILLNDLKGELSCNKFICKTLNFNSKLNQENFISAHLESKRDQNVLTIESDDAGSVLKALDISKHINGGGLSIRSTASFDSNKGTMRSEGELIIEDFVAVKTPVLGKLLTLASLKGISDLLNQDGITFKRFSAPFTIENNIITVKNARSEGASVGITANGTINRNSETIDLEGAIIPAHALNRILGSIPIVGKIVTGAKNEGVIATKYTIRGSYEDAKVKTNPLSILTPGLLRDLFGAIGKPSKSESE
jgi:uncharacterized protein YhdP